jgi:hypothetical protein
MYLSDVLAFDIERLETAVAGGELEGKKRVSALAMITYAKRLQAMENRGEIVAAKTDKRKFNRSCALLVLRAYELHGNDWFVAKDVIRAFEDEGINEDSRQAKHWGLIEEAGTHTGHGKTDGVWRVTSLGARFANNEVFIPAYRVTRNGTLLRLEGDDMNLRAALGEYFDYDKHMALQKNSA